MFLDSHDNLAVHKSVQYVQDRMKIEGGGPGVGGVAYILHYNTRVMHPFHR